MYKENNIAKDGDILYEEDDDQQSVTTDISSVTEVCKMLYSYVDLGLVLSQKRRRTI